VVVLERVGDVFPRRLGASAFFVRHTPPPAFAIHSVQAASVQSGLITPWMVRPPKLSVPAL
jgi:hypothetical protein